MDSETSNGDSASGHTPEPATAPQEANTADIPPQNVIDLAAEAIANAPGPGQLIEHTNQEKAIEALFLKAAGNSTTMVAKETGLDQKTINGLIARHDETYKVLRAEQARALAALSSKFVQVMAKKLQRMDEDPEQLERTNVRDLAVSMGITTEKSAAAHGEAGQVIEHRKTITFEDYQAAVLAKQKERAIDIEPEDES